MANLIEQLEASGLKPIVIDENTDFENIFRPTKHETNEEFIVRVMNFGCPTGGLIQAFIVEALCSYAADVVTSEETWDNGLISSVAWKRTGQWLLDELNKKYKG